MTNKIIYHENNSIKPYKPQEDQYVSLENVHVIADGVTHDTWNDDIYPIPSDSAEVASIICKEIASFLQGKPISIDLVKDAFIKANRSVYQFNKERPLYIDRENNGYSYGAATVAVICIEGNKLHYGVLDDCYVSVFSDDYIDHPNLKSYVDYSAGFLDENYSWDNMDTRKFWRKELRNNTYTYINKEYGYGALDGNDGFIKYLQTGAVELKDNDLVCLYTDGFIKNIQSIDFIKTLRENPFNLDTFEYINNFSKQINNQKEKTGIFIKHS